MRVLARCWLVLMSGSTNNCEHEYTHGCICESSSANVRVHVRICAHAHAAWLMWGAGVRCAIGEARRAKRTMDQIWRCQAWTMGLSIDPWNKKQGYCHVEKWYLRSEQDSLKEYRYRWSLFAFVKKFKSTRLIIDLKWKLRSSILGHDHYHFYWQSHDGRQWTHF